jgi:hypothetical protein
MDVTVRVWFAGSPADAFALQRMLEAAGAQVTWRPQGNLASDAGSIAMSLMASGMYDGIKAAVEAFRKRHPKAAVDISDEPDDLGFLPYE